MSKRETLRGGGALDVVRLLNNSQPVYVKLTKQACRVLTWVLQEWPVTHLKGKEIVLAIMVNTACMLNNTQSYQAWMEGPAWGTQEGCRGNEAGSSSKATDGTRVI